MHSSHNKCTRHSWQTRTKRWRTFSLQQLTANCVAVTSCLLSHVKLIWESPTTADTKLIYTVANAPFTQSSNRMAFSVDRNRKFFKRIISTPAVFKATSKIFGSQGCSKYGLNFFQHFLKILQFNSAFTVSFHEKPFCQVWQWRDFPEPITILCYV